MNSGVEALRAAVLGVISPSPWLICDCVEVESPSPWPPPMRAVADTSVPRDLGDDALDRPAGRELDDGKADQHDPEQGRDDQEQALEKIGCHLGTLARPPSQLGLSFAAFLGIVPPGMDNAALVARFHRRPAELVPVGDMVGPP